MVCKHEARHSQRWKYFWQSELYVKPVRDLPVAEGAWLQNLHASSVCLR